MGCEASGSNHLRSGESGDKEAHPYCGQGQLGYMWDRATFDRMAEEGRACLACVRTLERDTLATAIRDAAAKVGICHADVELTGPQLLMLCDDLATARPPAE